ncbi:hypothetical protein CJ197_07880 [Brachybacterium sp. UMB0905]|nr:hypothetical protein [Brachybacterium sp. Marseille-Q7125]PMC75695.1 hypothetical protein CJ197_07880 [Brachybacterium sp. UMB0905]
MYALLGELAELQLQATDTHSKLLGHGYRERTRIAPKLHEQSTVAEELCRRISERLGRSLVTPYEAELLDDFALTIADSLDAMEHTGGLLTGTEVGPLPTALLEAAKGIERAAELTVAASWTLSGERDLGDYYPQMRKLKRQGERLVRQALADLYGMSGSSRELMALRDVIESVRATISLQEQAARRAELLRVKDA